MRTCDVEGCAGKHYGRGYCKVHYTRTWRYGDPSVRHSPGGRKPRADAVTYSGLHQRLHRDLGPASARACVDCGTSAAHWSYSHGCDDEQSGFTRCRGRVFMAPFCLHPECYQARCVPCHRNHDREL
jgi:hypothetical protein